MSPIQIRPPASLEEYHQACALVDDVYFERVTSQRNMAHPKALLVAARNGEVFGSVGLRAGEQGTLPVEHYFGFSIEEAGPFARSAVCEIVQLAARKDAESCVFKGLIAACAQYLFVERS